MDSNLVFEGSVGPEPAKTFANVCCIGIFFTNLLLCLCKGTFFHDPDSLDFFFPSQAWAVFRGRFMTLFTVDTMLGALAFPLVAILCTDAAYILVLAELGYMAKPLALGTPHR